MANPRIEEVSDDAASDPEEMDVDAFDFARPQQGSLQSSLDPAAGSQIDPAMLENFLQQSQGQSQNSQPSEQQQQQQQQGMSDRDRARMESEQRERSKHFQCIYPIYFDASRSRQDGRRVRKEEAVTNPLARDLVDALQHIMNERGVGNMQVVFEPTKTHPKDWANPGRVRVLLKEEGRSVSSKIANSKCIHFAAIYYLFMSRRLLTSSV
jgi:signal recognition particle subunit SRP19